LRRIRIMMTMFATCACHIMRMGSFGCESGEFRRDSSTKHLRTTQRRQFVLAISSRRVQTKRKPRARALS
jgi:hypothetical protein